MLAAGRGAGGAVDPATAEEIRALLRDAASKKGSGQTVGSWMRMFGRIEILISGPNAIAASDL